LIQAQAPGFHIGPATGFEARARPPFWGTALPAFAVTSGDATPLRVDRFCSGGAYETRSRE
jgi:hypothetical protein